MSAAFLDSLPVSLRLASPSAGQEVTGKMALGQSGPPRPPQIAGHPPPRVRFAYPRAMQLRRYAPTPPCAVSGDFHAIKYGRKLLREWFRTCMHGWNRCACDFHTCAHGNHWCLR